MKGIVILIVCFSIWGCSTQSDPANKLLQSDSLVINFNTPGANTIDKTLATTEKTAIKKLARFIDSKASPAYKCGYDGNLLFYKNGAVTADVAFNFSGEGCRHFMQIVADQPSPTTMSNEAADFLKSLSEGRSWY